MISKGDTAFILICTALVALMTPWVALFYGALTGSVTGLVVQKLLASAYSIPYSILRLINACDSVRVPGPSGCEVSTKPSWADAPTP
jgi:hypothetical protein